VSVVALAECAHVLLTQYGIGQRDLIDALIGQYGIAIREP
jgi:hypothetical protein